MIDPDDYFDPFPHGVADYLTVARLFGWSFDTAWLYAQLDRRYREVEYGRDRQNAFSIESVLTFTKRHLRAAYELRDTMRYCSHEDCVYLALFDGECAFHAVGIECDEEIAA